MPPGGGTLVGRAWVPGKIPGPSVVSIVDGLVYDLCRRVSTMSALLERDNAVEVALDVAGMPLLGAIEDVATNSIAGSIDQRRPHLLAPCDLQAHQGLRRDLRSVSMIERVIEERAARRPGTGRGDARARSATVIGDDLRDIRPGSARRRRG